jgi:hypothetical protein
MRRRRNRALWCVLDPIRRPRDIPIWKLEAALNADQVKKMVRYPPPIHVIKLTMNREIAPYAWSIRTTFGNPPACADGTPFGSATLIGHLCWRLGPLGLLCGGGLALLLSLSILRRCGFFSCHAVHRFGRRVLIGFCRTSASRRLTGVAGRGARASVLAAGVAGTGVCGTNAKNDCGKACEDDLFCNHYASPWFPSFDE